MLRPQRKWLGHPGKRLIVAPPDRAVNGTTSSAIPVPIIHVTHPGSGSGSAEQNRRPLVHATGLRHGAHRQHPHHHRPAGGQRAEAGKRPRAADVRGRRPEAARDAQDIDRDPPRAPRRATPGGAGADARVRGEGAVHPRGVGARALPGRADAAWAGRPGAGAGDRRDLPARQRKGRSGRGARVPRAASEGCPASRGAWPACESSYPV